MIPFEGRKKKLGDRFPYSESRSHGTFNPVYYEDEVRFLGFV